MGADVTEGTALQISVNEARLKLGALLGIGGTGGAR